MRTVFQRLVALLVLALSAGSAQARETCLAAPYAGGSGEVAELAALLTEALAPHPSLAAALADLAPALCVDDSLYTEQGYFEPASNRIVLRAGLDPDFQLAILIHEVRHLEQFGRDVCPTTALNLSDYVRLRLALEADAAAATYAQWFADEDRRAMYAFAICSNYLDALDRQKVEPGKQRLSDDLAARLCVLPDGRLYDCILPP